MYLGDLEEIYEVDGEPNPEEQPIVVPQEEEELVPSKP